MTPLLVLVKITRPRFWAYTAGPYLLGYTAGLRPDPNLLVIGFWLGLLYFLFPANLYLYGINDWFDGDTDAFNDEKKENQEHRLTDQERPTLTYWLIGVMALNLVIFVLLPNGLARGWFAVFVILSTVYSAPPIRLKARAFLDSYSNVLYVIPGFLAYAITTETLPTPLMMIGVGLWAAGMHAFSALPDIEPDSKAGVETVAVRLGLRRGLLFVGLNWLGFALCMIAVLGAWGLIPLLYPALALTLYITRASVEKAYWWFPALNGALGAFAFIVLQS